MTERREYEMAQEDLRMLLDASKSTPVMYLSGGQPMFPTPQENANAAWVTLGKKMGFDSTTVKPSVSGNRFFSAVSTEKPECVQDDGTPWPTKYGCGGSKCDWCEP